MSDVPTPSANQIIPPRGVLRLCLEIELQDFHTKQPRFLNQLAEILEVPVQQIMITDLRKGCVLIRLEVPDEAQKRLEALWNARERSELLEQFVLEYVVKWLRFDDMVERQFFIIKF